MSTARPDLCVEDRRACPLGQDSVRSHGARVAELADALALGASAFGRAGSNPALRICSVLGRSVQWHASCGNSSAVEHCLAKAGVAGSSPVSRSWEGKACAPKASSRDGGTGRRRGLKILRGFPRAGSNPAPGRKQSAGWSNQEARRAHNPEVVGSNPTPATSRRRRSSTG